MMSVLLRMTFATAAARNSATMTQGRRTQSSARNGLPRVCPGTAAQRRLPLIGIPHEQLRLVIDQPESASDS